MPVKVVFNSFPLIFLSQLNFSIQDKVTTVPKPLDAPKANGLELFLQYDYQFYVPEVVINEINAKQDEASKCVNRSINNNSIIIEQVNLLSLANSLNERLGKGESDAIALATQLQSDYIILDDFAARREAIRLGLNVKGTLAIVKKMMMDNRIRIDDLEQFYQQLSTIKFRIKKFIFDSIFS